nr:uncharacterized protein LOC109185007 [Ipomoea trifida]
MQVHRYSDNLYRSFSSREEAVQAFNKFVEEHGDPSHNAETSTSCSSTSISKDGDGIERNPHLEMLDLLWVNVKSSIPGTLALDILSECKSLLVTSYDLQYEPGHILSFIYKTEPEDEGVNVFHGDRHAYFHS